MFSCDKKHCEKNTAENKNHRAYIQNNRTIDVNKLYKHKTIVPDITKAMSSFYDDMAFYCNQNKIIYVCFYSAGCTASGVGEI